MYHQISAAEKYVLKLLAVKKHLLKVKVAHCKSTKSKVFYCHMYIITYIYIYIYMSLRCRGGAVPRAAHLGRGQTALEAGPRGPHAAGSAVVHRGPVCRVPGAQRQTHPRPLLHPQLGGHLCRDTVRHAGKVAGNWVR